MVFIDKQFLFYQWIMNNLLKPQTPSKDNIPPSQLSQRFRHACQKLLKQQVPILEIPSQEIDNLENFESINRFTLAPNNTPVSYEPSFTSKSSKQNKSLFSLSNTKSSNNQKVLTFSLNKPTTPSIITKQQHNFCTLPIQSRTCLGKQSPENKPKQPTKFHKRRTLFEQCGSVSSPRFIRDLQQMSGSTGSPKCKEELSAEVKQQIDNLKRLLKWGIQ